MVLGSHSHLCQKPWESLTRWWEPHLPTDPNGVRLPILSQLWVSVLLLQQQQRAYWLCFSSVGFRVSSSLLSLFVRAGRLSSELWSLIGSKCYLPIVGVPNSEPGNAQRLTEMTNKVPWKTLRGGFLPSEVTIARWGRGWEEHFQTGPVRCKVALFWEAFWEHEHRT